MSNWQNLEIEKIADFNPRESLSKGSLARKIPMDCLRVFEKKIIGFEFANYSGGPKFRNGDTLLAKITPCLENGKTAKVDILNDDEVAFGSSEFIVLRVKENNDSDYLYYLARSPAFRKKAISCMEGTSGRKRVNEGVLKLQVLPIPNPDIQKKIAYILSALDAKIELNNQINAELEKMAKTLYDYWFVQFDFPDANGKPYKSSGGKMLWNEQLKREIPDGWKDNSLWEIAKYYNGLAMQKNRSTSDDYLPVIKIKEMNEGFSEKTEKARADISSEAIVNDGDVLFSWSATLDVKIWSGGKGALNQHIFKVTSNKYPKTFYYFELRNYLEHFKMMADNRKTTMGHITQDHLKQSRIAIPPVKLIEKIDSILAPILTKQLVLHQENQELVKIRDWLLPMLMNGQVSVK